MRTAKYIKLFTALVSLIFIVIMQFVCMSSSDVTNAADLSPRMQKEVERLAAFINPLNTEALEKSEINKKLDILVAKGDGNIIYWNTVDLGIQDFQFDNSGNSSISNGAGTIYYKPKGLSSSYLSRRNENLKSPTANNCSLFENSTDSIPRWITLFAYLLALTCLLQHLNKSHHARSINTTVALSSGFLIGAGFLYMERYLTLLTFFDTDFSLGLSLDILQIMTLVIIGSYWTLVGTRLRLKLNIAAWAKTWIAATIVSLFVIFIASTIRGVIHSDILCSTLDNPIQYSSAGIAFIILLVLLALIAFYLSVKIYAYPSHSKHTGQRVLGMSLGTLSAGALMLLWDPKIPLLAIMAFILAYLLILDIYVDQKRKTAVFAFLWMIIFSGFIASIIFYFQLSKDIEARQTFAQSLYTPKDQQDLSRVLVMDDVIRKSNITSQLASLPYPAKLDKNDFTTFLLEQLGGNLTDLTLSVECFEAGGATIFRDHFAQSSVLNGTLKNADRQAEHIYYDPLSASYLLNYYIENEGYNQSPLQLIVQLRNPEKDLSLDEKITYQFSIVKNQKIIAGSKNLLIPLTNNSISQDKSHQIIDDQSYVLHSPTEGIAVYVSRKLDGLLKPISLFSFILAISGLLLLLIGILNSRTNLLPKEVNILFEYQSSLRNKIQFTVILLTIFSFVLIGLMTIIYFKNVLEQRSNQSKELQITSILNNVQSVVSYSEEKASMLRVLSGKLTEVSHIHQKDLNLYDMSGNLIATSLNKVNSIRLPYPVHRSIHDKSSKHLHTSDVATTLSHFLPLVDNRGQIFGTLGIIDHNASYSSNLLDFLSTILNVYIFLFLVAGAIAVAISNSITRPLLSLSEKLKLFRLGKNQEPIKWSSKDEIGDLISNFNDLTAQLEESADIIAKTERDTAWREMAKQVAHEIKNPLTPMKLSIQHLQRVAKSDAADMGQRIDRVSKTLLEQFNNLDNIANSFSNFASMPQADNAKIVLNEVVEAVHDLFRKREDITINLSEPINDLHIYADRNQVVRVLNNIVKNAVQAIPIERHGVIEMSLEQVKDMAVIRVSDNGTGIPDDMKKKVFTPNFTTKNSGTGLGLAISANMIESFNGRIYFETTLGKGTDFFIEIPLMKLDTNFEGSNRVIL